MQRLLASCLMAAVVWCSPWRNATAQTAGGASGASRGQGVRVAEQATGAAAERRVALVIGNGAYKDSPLRNPVNDARGVAAALKTLGFEVTLQENAGRAAMFEAVRSFGAAMTAGRGVALFYYAGHGMQVGGANYLIPVGADIQQEDEVQSQALEADLVLRKMDSAKGRVNIVILDACRNNPFARSFRSQSRGLATMDAPSGTIIAYATAPGSVASDGTGANGPYTSQLLDAMRVPGFKIEDVFKRVRSKVQDATSGQQVPWEASSLTGDFYFVPGAPGGRPEEKPTPPAGDFDVADIERWAKYDASMAEGHRKVLQIDEGSLDAKAKAEAWSRFLASFSSDNPYSGEDDTMRARAREREAYWRNWSPQPTAAPRPTSASAAGNTVAGSAVAGMEFVRIEPGEFDMGSPREDVERYDGEKLHHVRITRAFLIGKYEVTQGQWQAVRGFDSSKSNSCGSECPVEYVSWFDAVGFANAVSRKAGLEECYKISGRTVSIPRGLAYAGFRLPTEAEWEYAARAGTRTAIYGPDLDGTAWYKENSGGKTHPVGLKSPNAWGAYDMIGNVQEWCQDWLGGYPSRSVTDPLGPSSGSDRVSRGGSRNSGPRDCRLAHRGAYGPDANMDSHGFRLARSVP